MTIRGEVALALEREISKAIRRHGDAASVAALNRRRYEKRSGVIGATPATFKPAHWEADPQFNPFFVRARVRTFSHTLAKKVSLGTFLPRPALVVKVPKPSGGYREISISTVPDAAVSYWLGHRLIERNSYRFSSYSYAYRADRNAHHAIVHLMGKIRRSARLFVLEYDFTKYFDSIRHDYLEYVLSKHFLISDRELRLVQAMLGAPRAHSVASYSAGKFSVPHVGVPQGSNISLFLANVACFELDREIEEVGVTFARYADDTLILCDTYEKADACAKLLQAHGDRSGTQINFEKSPGVSLLTNDANAEVRPKRSVDYLSHNLSFGGVRLAPKAIRRMKARAARIIYQNLLLQPKRAAFNPARCGLGFRDWDLVTCVNELRRYVYGRVTEQALSLALSGIGPVHVTLCAMSFYPTVDESGEAGFRALDGWMVDILERAYALRVKLLAGHGVHATPIAAPQLIDGSWYAFPSVAVETRLPSFWRSWRYVQRAANVYGLDHFPGPSYDYI